MTKMLLGLGAILVTNLGGAAAMSEPTDRPVVVVAEPEQEMVVARRVSYADLDLATSDGERALVRRVRAAVKQVCAVEMGPSALFYAEYSCRKSTWRDTKPLVGLAIGHARLADRGASSTAAAVIVVRVAR